MIDGLFLPDAYYQQKWNRATNFVARLGTAFIDLSNVRIIVSRSAVIALY